MNKDKHGKPILWYKGDDWTFYPFHPEQFYCKYDGKCILNVDALEKLCLMQQIFYKFQPDYKARFRITSGYRSEEYNEHLRKKGIGAVKNSYHIHSERGGAFDIAVDDMDPQALYDAAIEAGFHPNGIGLYPGSRFIHVDNRPLEEGKPGWVQKGYSRNQFFKLNWVGNLEEESRPVEKKSKDKEFIAGGVAMLGTAKVALNEFTDIFDNLGIENPNQYLVWIAIGALAYIMYKRFRK